MSGIFISYRREDTPYVTGRLHDRLASRFGRERIVWDLGTGDPGGDLGPRIEEAVGSCDAFLAIMGKRWPVDRNPPGKRPIGVPRDWVLKEIEAALARPDLLVVPVLVEDATMPDQLELPYSIRSLAGRRAMRVTEERWDDEVQQIVEVLEGPVQRQLGAGGATEPGARQPPPPEVPPRRRRFRR